jgi:poly [ADP-ribose] polymerase
MRKTRSQSNTTSSQKLSAGQKRKKNSSSNNTDSKGSDTNVNKRGRNASSLKKDTGASKKTKKPAKCSPSSANPPMGNSNKKKGKVSHPVDKDIPSYYSSHPITSFHVVQSEESGLWYDAVLNQCNIMFGNNNNKYYRIQMLKKSDQEAFYVWLKWGRVGEPSTGRKLLGPYSSEEAARPTFAQKYKSKTGNNFDTKVFEPKKGKYIPVEIDNDIEVSSEFGSQTESNKPVADSEYMPSKLDGKTKDLIGVLFSKDMRDQALNSFNLDLKRLPLGVPSKKQIQFGVSILNKIEDKIQGSHCIQDSFSSLSSQFYTAIPHSFGRSRPPVIQSQTALQERYDMCNILIDMFSTNETMRKIRQKKDDARKKQIPNPIDLHYDSLNADLSVLGQDSSEFNVVKAYFDKTKGYYSNANLLDVWRVDRNGENERFRHFDQLEDRRLLWHGTNIAVVAPILTSGLRIMPHSGGRVGAGIYLASMNEKSAGYTSGYGSKYACMFLAEAALGTMHQVTSDGPHASGLRKAPKGFDSVHAVGRTTPKKWIEVDIDGKKVKVGHDTETKASTSTSFSHDEFLVYEEAQVRIRYVLTVKF